MVSTLRISAGFDDSIDAICIRIQALDQLILFDKIEVDATGVGGCLYDKLATMSLRAPVTAYMPWLEKRAYARA